MSVYLFLESLDNQTLFLYIIIFIVCLYFFMSKNIGLNVIFGIGVAFVVVSYLYEKKITSVEIKEKQDKVKYDTIRPKKEILKEDPEMVDFVFSVQDFYAFNPSAFEEFIDNLESVMKLHDNMLLGSNDCDQYYTVLDGKVNNCLNAFHSIIHRLPESGVVTEKFNRAHQRLNTLLTKYLNDAHNVCNTKIINEGLNIRSRLISTGPKGSNYHKDDHYEFY